MKKTLSLILVLLLMLSSAVALGEDSQALYHEESGITFTVPAGYIAEDASEDDVAALLIMSERDENIVFIYQVYYDDGVEGMWLEDLDEEQIAAVAQVLADGFGDLTYAVEEEDGATYLLVMNEELTYAAVVSLLNGWVCALSAFVSEGYEMTEEAWTDLYTLQMAISYEG